ncbi:Pirin-domain-containing protein [Tilletiaria anomala UBC 951]|uniref:Pirin-domain-containing protein n=1 Tax=Tilletiaria anomala (strain ATCC 24038 / CBS 436.72 / UBC 951) TaxID=1037660 RepID=A0A066VTR4_TILAU|nr:Pirin-domain-containing protein [Tilletiaria anomala UBC 951]KDN43678.1 Pirin-domain-containing protein [Tilletiaria anomala UBC 951]
MATTTNGNSPSHTLAAHPDIAPRRWFQRGHADHGWLKTFHTFSFASYYDPKHMGFSDLRVINEDRVEAETGFPTHPHSNAEIFSYIVSGELTHKDSMGNAETLKRGDLQFTSGGTGIRHSEYNNNPSKEVHFAQIWYVPDKRNLTPQYYTSQTPDEMKRDVLKTLIKPMKTFTPEEQVVKGVLPSGRPIPANNSLVTRASILTPSKSVMHIVGEDSDVANETSPPYERWLYVHLLQTTGYKGPEMKDHPLMNEAALKMKTGAGELQLNEGDGVYVKKVNVGEAVEFESTGGKDAEFLLFDLRAQ